MAQQKNGNVALCPECEGPVRLSGKLQIGQKFSCRRCGSALVIIERKPLELGLADDYHAGSKQTKADRKKGRDAETPYEYNDQWIEGELVDVRTRPSKSGRLP